MARTKRVPSPARPVENTLDEQLAAATAQSISFMLLSATAKMSFKCRYCKSVFWKITPEDKTEHISSCGPPSSSSGTQIAPQASKAQEVGSTMTRDDHVPSAHSTVLNPPAPASTTSTLTTPPGSYDVPASGEGSLADPAELGDEFVGNVEQADERETVVDDETTVNSQERPRITPYVEDELEYYDFEELTEAEAAEAMAEDPTETRSGSQEQDADVEETAEIPKAPNFKKAGQPSTAPTLTTSLQVPEANGGDDTPEPLSTAASVIYEDSDAENLVETTGNKTKRYGFPKLTSLEEYETYLKNPEDMSYEDIYRKTEVVADHLSTLSKEFRAIDQEVKDFSKSRIPDKVKEAEDKQRVKDEEEEEKWRIHDLYYSKLEVLMAAADEAAEKQNAETAENEVAAATDGDAPATDAEEALAAGLLPTTPAKKQKRAKAFRDMAERLLKDYPDEPEHSARLLASLFLGNTLSGMRKLKEQKAATKDTVPVISKNKLDLIEVPLQNLDAADRALYATRQKKPISEELELFELRKTADVYGLPFKAATNNKPATVELRDRNAVDDDQAEEDRNGRPKRNRNKRTTYETEQSENQGDSSEELPAKRRRTQATTVEGSPSRTRTTADTRDGSPAPRTFPSGKRIGRPPGAKTKVKPAAKSKLQQSHIPPPSSSENETPKPDGQSHSQDLPAKDEAQLQEAAQSLVERATKDSEAPAVPKKGKHGGARTKGVKVDLDQQAKLAQGGRSKKQPAAVEEEPPPTKVRKGGRQKKNPAGPTTHPNVDDNEVIQSTEQDDESRFASASTSRPTTSSSAATATTLGSRRAARQSTREQSKAFGEHPAAAKDLATSSNSKPKRKRGANTSQETRAADSHPVETVAPAPKKRKTAKMAKTEPEAEVVFSEADGEASVPVSGRSKRKRTTTDDQDSIQVALPNEVEEVEDVPHPSAKRRKGGKAAAVTQSSVSDPINLYESTPEPAKLGGRARKVSGKADATQNGGPVPSKSGKGILILKVGKGAQKKLDAAEGSSTLPKSRARNAKAKAIKQETTESEYASGDAEELEPKTRKARPVTRGKNGKRIAEDDSDEFGATPRKRARKAKIDLAVDPESEFDELASDGDALDIEPAPRRVTKTDKAAVGSGAVNKPAARSRGGRKTKTETVIEPQYDMEELDEEEEVVSEATSRQPSKAKGSRKGKAIAEATPGLEGTEAEGELNEAEIKAKRKSEKLSAATKARWADGKMAGPMLKRQATNEAKKAARLAAKAAQGEQPTTIAGPSTVIAPAPVPVPQPIVAAAPAPTGSASSSATRTSGRKRKPTSRARAMGMDGADDSSSDDERDDFRSEYDQFQALSSPGTLALGKRQRRSFVNLAATLRSSDEDSE